VEILLTAGKTESFGQLPRPKGWGLLGQRGETAAAHPRSKLRGIHQKSITLEFMRL